jgi:hypothetical protein
MVVGHDEDVRRLSSPQSSDLALSSMGWGGSPNLFGARATAGSMTKLKSSVSTCVAMLLTPRLSKARGVTLNSGTNYDQ